jgi:hypothetical protein
MIAQINTPPEDVNLLCRVIGDSIILISNGHTHYIKAPVGAERLGKEIQALKDRGVISPTVRFLKFVQRIPI